MSRVAIAVLAAGGSSRMGQPKQLLPFRGRTLLRHTAEVAVKAGGDPVLVVLGHRANALAMEVSDLPVTVIENPAWASGPGTSVRAVMEEIEPIAEVEAAVFLLCDQPFVTATHVHRLLAAWRQSRLPMVASSYFETVGVPALFARECFAALRNLDAFSGAKQLLVRSPEDVTVVPFPAGAIDLDTPEDYEQLVGSVNENSVGRVLI